MGRNAHQIMASDVAASPARDALYVTLDLLALLHDRPGQAKQLPATARFPFESSVTRAWRDEQQRFTRVCGCAAGGIAGLLALAAAATWSLSHAQQLSLAVLAARTVGLALAAALAATVAGKLAGLAWGTARFRRATVRAIAELGRALEAA
jgi:hypothetical protein